MSKSAKLLKTLPKSDNAVFQEYLDALVKPPRTFKKREIVHGIVIASNDSEMLVDVGGRAEGVVAGRELKLNGEKIEKKEGDKILVYVVNPENDKGQIELSIRRTGTALKWHELDTAQADDKSVKVRVIEANTGGVIVEIGGGLRGFVPTSQLDNKRIYPSSSYGSYDSKENAKQVLQNRLAELIGTELEVMVIEIDKEKNRVILSEKLVGSQADMQKRANILSTLKVGDMLEGEVTGIAPFGLFVNAQGLEGLVHLSEISWDKVSNPSDYYKPGDKLRVQVIDIQDKGKRIAFSIKRLQEDPWDEIIKNYKIGQIITGEVTKVVDYGAFVRIEEGLNGLIHISELSDKLVKDPNEIVKNGQKVEVKVISMSKEDRHLGLSIKRLTKAVAPGKPEKPDSPEAGIAPEMAELQDLLDKAEK
jgi:small subunit ribosomal protein S1